MGNIYISSVAFQVQDFDNIIRLATKHQWPVEFSAGLQYDDQSATTFLEAGIQRMAHNYFLADEPAYVMNLATSDEALRTRCVNHCKKMLAFTKRVNAPFYAAHAGFCIDPKPEELGRKINYSGEIDRQKHLEIFLQSLHEILAVAEAEGVDFYIENNVLAKFNFEHTTINPLLCTDHSDIEWVFSKVKHPRFGLLLDTAHLKVSAQTLGLNSATEWEKIMPYVKAFHHSDNNGLVDNNQPLGPGYWCESLLQSVATDMTHVVEVKNISEEEINNQIQFIYQIIS